MFENLKVFVSENKVQIVKKGAIALGAVVGLVIAGLIVKNAVESDGGEMERLADNLEVNE